MRKTVIFLILFLALPIWAGVRVEFYGGAGVWSLNLLKGKIESFARERVDQIISEDLEEKYTELRGATYQHTESFSSGGGNFSLGLRFYPGGKNSSFSLGIILLRAKMDMVLEGEILAKKGQDSASFNGSGEVSINSYAALVSLQWEFVPSSGVSPYLSFGLGGGTLNGTASYTGYVRVNAGGTTDNYTENQSKTLEELRQEEGIPNFMPFIKAALGIRGRLGENASIYVEGGFLDGFTLGAGLGIIF